MEAERARPGGGRTFPCGACGASLTFQPGADQLHCEYCGSEVEIPGAGPGEVEEVVEHDFRAGLARARRMAAADLVTSGHEVECKGCGATTVLDGQAGHCPYCDSPVVVAVESSEATIAPEGVLPFKIDDRRARERFHAWLGSLWFAPSDLKRRAAAGRVTGVYMPYWTYDAATTTTYRGKRGEHYWETETYTDSEGKQKTRRVRKTRWYSASGTVYVPFDDVLVYAARSLPRSLVEALEPWDLPELEPYDPAYLSGFTAERYSIDLEEGFRLAKGRMQGPIERAVRRDIGGDEQRIHHLRTSYRDVTYKHLLLPLWISSFRYGEEVYRFLVNARTGEVQGERPWSWIKIALAVLGALVAAALIALAATKLG